MNTSATTYEERRGRAALAALHYPWAQLGYAVAFRPGRAGVLGATNSRQRLVTIFVRRSESEVQLRATIGHELGHVLDFTHGSGPRRTRYRHIRGIGARSWYPCDRCNDLASPAGDFAEVFAYWLTGGDFQSRLRAAPTAAELRRLQPLFTDVGADAAGPATEAAPSPSPSCTVTEVPGATLTRCG
ncbi:MAG: hypothetical protein LC779_11335 [Actinobacteria bacterium]|nr:hypothetical protein [Actinomycetota bacterium]